MITKIQKWGNSQGVRLSKDVLSEADMEVGEAVDVVVRKRTIIVRPARLGVRGRHDLRALVKRLPKSYQPEELDWGPPVGREAW
jgi:antitoxin MazE